MSKRNLDGEATRRAFAERLRQLCQARDVSGKRLAALADVSENTVSSWLTAKHLPDRVHSERVASGLGISLDELYGRVVSPAPTTAQAMNSGEPEDEAQAVIARLASLGDAAAALHEIAKTAPPLLDALAEAQALVERWSGPQQS
jgi:transcriptional regulator with XRE-family HTH domain